MNTPEKHFPSCLGYIYIYSINAITKPKKIRHMSNQQSVLNLDTLRDMYMLTVHNIKLSTEREERQFTTDPLPGFKIGDKLLVGIIPWIHGIQI